MISVIIPVYNTAGLLPQCIESVTSQDYASLEIILVDDASTDASLDVCEKYAARDRRIKVLHKERNEGVESARFSGFAAASGEYIMYVDSDDWLAHCSVLSAMKELAEQTGADYVETLHRRVFCTPWRLGRELKPASPTLIEQPELFEEYYLSFFGCNRLCVNIWGKLYRKDLLDRAQLRPEGLGMGEDLVYNMKLFPHLSKVCIMHDIGYNYRSGGLTSGYNPNIFSDRKHLYRFKKQCIEQYDYRKAEKYVVYELKNGLHTDICQRIAYGGADRRHMLEFIRSEFNDPLYDDFGIIDKSEPFWRQPFVEAFCRRDAVAVYDICRREAFVMCLKSIIKRMAMPLMNIM